MQLAKCEVILYEIMTVLKTATKNRTCCREVTRVLRRDAQNNVTIKKSAAAMFGFYLTFANTCVQKCHGTQARMRVRGPRGPITVHICYIHMERDICINMIIRFYSNKNKNNGNKNTNNKNTNNKNSTCTVSDHKLVHN